ncbi:MAG: cation diffusion facilitator family transporter [Mesonia hippocampi]|uniref:cation diffusion facilitator family transporter n=1 Tax=Mesonia hippocampi TaxID=1628250 RepID=UPI003F9CB56F
MGAEHQHSSSLSGKRLLFSILLNVGITLAQFIGGIISGSLSLLSDALHNFTDVISLVISYIAHKMAKKNASISRTFGYKRAEIMAAFVNAASLIVIAIILIKEAIVRFYEPQVINSTLVIWLAIVAILGNGLSVLLMKKDSQSNLNMRSAYLHLFTDMLASIAVLIGGLFMKYYQLYWIDSILTIMIAVYLIVVGYKLLKSSFKILMLYTPTDIDVKKVVAKVCEIPAVKNIHHIHIWSLNEDEIHLEAHLDLHENISVTSFDVVLQKIEKLVNKEFNINHVTIQPEHNKPDSKAIIIQD